MKYNVIDGKKEKRTKFENFVFHENSILYIFWYLLNTRVTFDIITIENSISNCYRKESKLSAIQIDFAIAKLKLISICVVVCDQESVLLTHYERS